MAKKLYEESNIQEIANAIRDTSGSTDTYTTDEMPAAIRNLGGGTQIFVATYGTTTNAEIKEAIESNKIVFCEHGVYMANLLRHNNDHTRHVFGYITQTGHVELLCGGNKWTSSTYNFAPKSHADDLNIHVPAANSSDDGKVLGVEGGVPGWIEAPEGGTGGGVKSWNDLEDKPFYDETYTGTMSFQYDGDPTGKTTVVIPDAATLVKTSDWTTEPNYLIGATGTFGAQSMTITEEMITDMRGYGVPCVVVAESMYIAYSPFTFDGVTFPESGTYIEDMGVSASLVVTGTLTRVKTLDPKYLPSGYGGGGGGASNVHVLDIGSAELDITAIDLSAYANGDVLLIVQNMSQ